MFIKCIVFFLYYILVDVSLREREGGEVHGEDDKRLQEAKF